MLFSEQREALFIARHFAPRFRRSLSVTSGSLRSFVCLAHSQIGSYLIDLLANLPMLAPIPLLALARAVAYGLAVGALEKAAPRLRLVPAVVADRKVFAGDWNSLGSVVLNRLNEAALDFLFSFEVGGAVAAVISWLEVESKRRRNNDCGSERRIMGAK